jgi:hypothetical protein
VSQGSGLSAATRGTLYGFASQRPAFHELFSCSPTGAEQTRSTAGSQIRAGSPRTATKTDETLRRSEQKVLDALAWLATIGFSPAHDVAVACLAGYRVRTSGWVGIRRKLRKRDLIVHDGGPARLALTQKGRAHVSLGHQPGSPAELHEVVLARLNELEGRILQTLLGVYPRGINETVLARRYDDGAFRTSQGRLRDLGLIHSPVPGSLRASDVLFRPRTAGGPVTEPGPPPTGAIPQRLRLVSGKLRFGAPVDLSGRSS